MLDLTPAQFAMVRAVLYAHSLRREVRAFGSCVSGLARRYTDLDLMLMGEEPVTDIIRADLREDFDESALPFRVDKVTWSEAPVMLRAVVEPEGVVIQLAQEARD
ncbi:nucleotidyltransferase family protein [Methylolobus aquaticus]